MIIHRRCAICGKELTITVNEDGTYRGGHYFGKIPVDYNVKKIKDAKNTLLGNIKVIDIEPIKEVEYWECDECYNSGD